jgi:hypothetical protein
MGQPTSRLEVITYQLWFQELSSEDVEQIERHLPMTTVPLFRLLHRDARNREDFMACFPAADGYYYHDIPTKACQLI